MRHYSPKLAVESGTISNGEKVKNGNCVNVGRKNSISVDDNTIEAERLDNLSSSLGKPSAKVD